MERVALTLGVVVAGVLVWQAYELVDLFGVFKSVSPIGPPCSAVSAPGLSGCEDIHINSAKGYALLSCDATRDRWFPPVSHKDMTTEEGGIIFLYDLDSSILRPLKLVEFSGDFHPHGLSYLEEAGKEFVFVVNHQRPGSVIDVLELNTTARTLTLLKRVKHELVFTPNDIAAVSATPPTFYFSNDHRYAGGLMRVLEDYLRLPLTAVYFYDGESIQAVAEGIRSANGMTLSPARDKLYVSEVLGANVLVFDRDAADATGKLTLTTKVHLDTLPDNIFAEPTTGNLYVGAHYKALDAMKHMQDKKNFKAPSNVVVIKNNTSHERFLGVTYMFEHLLLTEQLSGSSAAAVDLQRKRLLVGGVIDDGILDCTLSEGK